MKKEELLKIKEEHPTSYKGIYQSYDWKEIRKSWPFWVSIISSILFFCISIFSAKNTFDILELWTNQVMSIFPNLLGFNLGGYALIIGFGNTELIEAMTEKPKENKTSVFQKLSGIFAFAILLQLAAFILSFGINFFIKLNFTSSNNIIVCLVNGFLTIILSFFGFWGLLILPNLVTNVFSFGQGHHFKLTLKRIEKEEASDL